MLLMPRRRKYRKEQRGQIRGNATRCNRVSFGDYGLMALESAWIPARQIEAARVIISRSLGKGGSLYIRIFPHKPISAKPAETRMGKGKGEPEYYAAVVKPGTILYEIANVPESEARRIFYLAANKLCVKTKMVGRLPR